MTKRVSELALVLLADLVTVSCETVVADLAAVSLLV